MSERATKILLVDDETGILDTLKILFTGEGKACLVMATGTRLEYRSCPLISERRRTRCEDICWR